MSQYQSLIADHALAVVPSDTVNLSAPCLGIYVGGAGNVSIVTLDGNTVVFTAPPVGSVIPCRASRVNATLTTATLLVALW